MGLANGQVWYDKDRSGRVKEHHPAVAGCIYSDDRGKTWQEGFLTHGIEESNEATVTQLRDGRFLFGELSFDYGSLRFGTYKR